MECEVCGCEFATWRAAQLCADADRWEIEMRGHADVTVTCSGCGVALTKDGVEYRSGRHPLACCPPVTVAWVASEEVSGLQGSMLLPGDVLQEGLPF